MNEAATRLANERKEEKKAMRPIKHGATRLADNEGEGGARCD
jgi:hypothetical protein